MKNIVLKNAIIVDPSQKINSMGSLVIKDKIIYDLILNKNPRLPINSFTLHRFQNQNILNSDKYDLTLHGWYKMIAYVCVKVTEKLVLNK